jgi:general secretion pathway protein G
MMTVPLQAQSQRRTSDHPSSLVPTKETALKEALFQTREPIDKYHADKKRYPSNLAVLVSEGYIGQILTDPFTNRPDSWKIVRKPSARPGIFDIRSASDATSIDGSKYSTW